VFQESPHIEQSEGRRQPDPILETDLLSQNDGTVLRRRAQARRPPPASTRPGSPAPTIGTRTGATLIVSGVIVPSNVPEPANVRPVMNAKGLKGSRPALCIVRAFKQD
jgi:hypothetical protein